MLTQPSPELRPPKSAKPVTLEDPLDYLPFSAIDSYEKGQTIYTHGQPSTRIYLVVKGKVKILRGDSSARAVVDVYRSDDLFGESALTGDAHRDEEAVALERTEIMSWSRQEIEDSTLLRPQLAIALLQLMVRRSVEFGDRIASFSVESIERRLMRTLVRFAGRFGKEIEDGTVTMGALTHLFLSQYVGTSREMVTQYMNRLRREGYLDYSRDEISLQPHALTAWRTIQ